MTIASYSNITAAQSEYQALFTQQWDKGPQVYVQDVGTQKINTDGAVFVNPVVTSTPGFREWTGSKAYKDLRAFSQSITMTKYEKTITLDRLMVTTDRSGAVKAAISNHLNTTKRDIDQLIFTNLIANTWTGYDGVSLLNDAHPNTNSTGDNLTTSALSFPVYRDGRAAMRGFTDEDGRYMNVLPTDLWVGPAQERIALEIAGASRPVAVSNAGAYDGTSNIVGATQIPNVFQGEIRVSVYSPITSNRWFMCDLSNVVKPLLWVILRAPEPVLQDGSQMELEQRFTYDRFNYSVEFDGQFAAGFWQYIYGSVTA